MTSNFSTTHYYYLDGTQGSSSAPLVWYVAYATVFDVTSSEKYTTTINSDGIYTSTLNASQIVTGTLSADRIAAGSITSAKLDAASIRSNIINVSYINGLTWCLFQRHHWRLEYQFFPDLQKQRYPVIGRLYYQRKQMEIR